MPKASSDRRGGRQLHVPPGCEFLRGMVSLCFDNCFIPVFLLLHTKRGCGRLCRGYELCRAGQPFKRASDGQGVRCDWCVASHGATALLSCPRRKIQHFQYNFLSKFSSIIAVAAVSVDEN